MGDRERNQQIEYDDISMKIKLILTRCGSTFGTLRFDEKSFIITLLTFTPYWDYTPTIAIHADSPGVYTINYIINLSAIKKIHLKRDIINSSVVNGLRQPILSSFILDKPSGYKVFSEPQTVHYKKNI